MKENGGVDMEIRHWVSTAWGHLKKGSGVLGDRTMPVNLTGEDIPEQR